MNNKINKRICFLYTETNGLHSTNHDVSKKKLYCFARLVTLNYEIGYFNEGKFYSDKKIRQIIKPRSMFINSETIKFHGITQEYALSNGIDPEEAIEIFKSDIKNVSIIVTHGVDFHLKTIIAEAIRYNCVINFNNYVIIDTLSFFHSFGFLKLKDLALKLKIKEINESNESNVELIKNIFYKLYSKYEKSLIKT